VLFVACFGFVVHFNCLFGYVVAHVVGVVRLLVLFVACFGFVAHFLDYFIFFSLLC